MLEQQGNMGKQPVMLVAGPDSEIASCSIRNPYFTSFWSWLRKDMPQFNARVLAHQEEPAIFRGPIQDFVDGCPEPGSLGLDEQLEAIKYLGFAISSMERHMQDRAQPAGAALQSIRGAEQLLLTLGRRSGHPPRDSLYTFAYWNRAPESITFTGDTQEELFIDIVNKSSDNLLRAGTWVRPITQEEMALSDPNSTFAFNEAAIEVGEARQQLLRYLKKDPITGLPAYTQAFFRDVMRQYNCNWSIAGESWGPPTAANAVPQMRLDFLTGTVIPGYAAHLRERYKYFTAEDQRLLDYDIQGLSVLDIIGQSLNFGDQPIAAVMPEQLVTAFKVQPEQSIKSIRGFVELAYRMGTLSALHWTLINFYLIKPNQMEEQMKKGAVDNTKGGSGMEFPELQEIRDMRRLHPGVVNLSRALDLLPG